MFVVATCVVVAVVVDASVIRNCSVAVASVVGATFTAAYVVVLVVVDACVERAAGTCVVVDVAVVMVETSVMATRRSDVVFNNIITL